MRTSHDAVLGCLLGGAIGDSLGGARERGRLSLSDDTQLTLATCEAIVARGFVSPEAIAERFVAWFRAGRLSGLGSSTLKALRDLDAGAHWALSGAGGEMSAGNGAAMRIAPVGFLLDPSDRAARVVIRDVCRITHRNDEAYVGALAVLLALHAAVRSKRPATCAAVAERLPDSRVRDRLLELADVDPESDARDLASRFGSSGHVADTVPLAIALSSRMTEEDFEMTLRALVESCADADTTGAIAGQLAGIRLGASSLPKSLLALSQVQGVWEAAEEFARRVSHPPL